MYVYDAYIYVYSIIDPLHVCMMHEYMIILVPDVCTMQECTMYITMILVTDPDADA